MMYFFKEIHLSDITSRQAAIVIIAICQVIFGIITLLCNETIFNNLLYSQLVVKEGTRTFQAWEHSPVPTYTSFYFFSMLNAEDYVKNNVKPIIEEKGPYVFREEQQKVNLVWHEDSTISYNRRKFWYFEPEKSVGPLSDSVVTLNLPMVTAVNYARNNFMMEFGLSDMLATVEAQLFLNRTVGELLFDGYDDPILEIGASFDDEEGAMPVDKFAYFYKRNGTSWADGTTRMHTGEADIERFGDIITWNGKNTTQAYKGECSKIEGSADGLLTPGKLLHGDHFEIWAADVCRKLRFEKLGHTYRHGISVQKFSLSDLTFDNGTKCKENLCYDNNLPSGLQNVSNCKMNAPAFLSRPHFDKADRFYAKQFQIGVHPETEKHDSYFLIEPHTSIPLEVNLALQLNVKVEKSEGMEYIFQNLSTIYYPVLWFKASVELPGGVAGALKLLLNIPSIMVGASIVGVIMGLVGIGLVYRNVTRGESNLDKDSIDMNDNSRVMPFINYLNNIIRFKKINEKSINEDSQ